MSISVKLHPYYHEFTGGRETVEAVGSTVREVIDDLEKNYPGIREQLLDERGRIQGFIEMFINSEIVYQGEADKPVKDGDEIEVLTIVAGG